MPAICIDKAAICIFSSAICVEDLAICVFNPAICIDRPAICVFSPTICVDKAANNLSSIYDKWKHGAKKTIRLLAWGF